LLVVIAIIGILAAILFPVFAQAREKAYMTSCMSNQRQLAIAIQVRTQDKGGDLPLPGTWVEEVGLSSDAKVFDCPSSRPRGVPSAPDYGMNAFLYDFDENGNIAELSAALIENPATIELTTDIKGSSDSTTGSVLHDSFVNPFPQTPTAPGFGLGGNTERRHSEGIVVSFLDGHVALAKKLELGNGTSRYNLPRGVGRFYVDFSEIEAEDFYTLMSGLWSLNVPGTAGIRSTGSIVYNKASKTCDIKNGTLQTNAEEWGTVWCWMGLSAAKGRRATFMAEGTVTDGVEIQWGNNKAMIANPVTQPAESDYARFRWGQAVSVDTANNYVQFGQLKAYTQNTQYPVDPRFPVNAWFDPPGAMGGTRLDISTVTSQLKIESLVSFLDLYPGFPTVPTAYWQCRQNTGGRNIYQFDTVTLAQGSHETTVTVNNTETIKGSTPILVVQYDTRYPRVLWVYNGTFKIKRLLYSSSN
jgi:prepilin-type processing-associated H-X9-DG protein